MQDLVTRLIALDEGTLADEERVELFAYLIRSGLAWSLQGRIGREAADYVRGGVISETGEIH